MNSGIKIEKSVPMPPMRGRTGHYGEITQKLLSMKVGDSFLWPRNKTSGITGRVSLLRQQGRFKGRVSQRTVSDTHVRIWRIE